MMQLVQIFNRMGYAISYRELKQVDNASTQRTIRRAESYHVPVPPSASGFNQTICADSRCNGRR